MKSIKAVLFSLAKMNENTLYFVGASHAELKMARDLKMLKAKMEQVQLATDQLKVSLHYYVS